jgi:DNA-binding NarL/FixJ family response regulator
MELKTLIIIDHDYYLRQSIREVIADSLQRYQIVEYTLAQRCLDELRRLSVDLMITSSRLLDSDGAALAKRARSQMPLLPIITLLEDRDRQPPGGIERINRFVPKNLMRQLLPAAILSLLQNDSLGYASYESLIMADATSKAS